jgi:hypothetical protein
MNYTVFSDYLRLYQSWSDTATGIAWGQWRLFATHCQAGARALETALAAFGAKAPAPPESPAGTEDLASVALDRVRKGLPPPREVYAAQNRGRIDWSQFSEWARPSDPELFGDCPHEG